MLLHEKQKKPFLIVDVSHSAYNITRRLFSLKQNIFWLCGQAFTSFQHGSFMSEEMLDFIILYTWKVYQKILIYNFALGQKQYIVL